MRKINLQKEKYFLPAIIITLVLGLLVRLVFVNYESGDYLYFLSKWIDKIELSSGWERFGLDVGNYTCPYLYVLAAITFVPFNELYLIKFLSVAFDVFAAYIAYLIVFELTKNKTNSLLAFFAVFLCPTVILNSGAWAQCDSIYSSFVLCSVLYLIKDKPAKAMFFFAVAFALKLQSIFFAPIFIFLWLKKKVKFKHFFIIPIVYVISCIPAILCGRDVMSALTVYLKQGSTFNSLSMNASSIWAVASDLNYESEIATYVGIILAAVFVLAFMTVVLKSGEIESKQVFDIAFILMLAIPFLLPRMHERYFYCTDLFSIIYATVNLKKLPVCFLMISASFYTYMRYFAQTLFKPFPLTLATILLAVAIVIVIVDYTEKYIKNQRLQVEC